MRVLCSTIAVNFTITVSTIAVVACNKNRQFRIGTRAVYSSHKRYNQYKYQTMCLKKYSFYEHLTKHHHTIGGWQGLAVVFRGRIWLTRHPLQHLTTYLTRLHLHELRNSKVTKSISKSTKINRIKSSYHPHLRGARGGT